ncbi:hypothetical protein P4B35_08015 [Pontiellaceae bacterium B12227]|nr:hypothetical protein [Pontiellaceae bacterium B12227]
MACWRRALFPILGSLLMLGGSFADPLNLAESMDQLTLLTSNLWKTGEVEGRACLILHTAGEQRPPVRRPAEFALLKSEQPIGAFTIEAATLEPEAVKNRDVSLIFGYQDDTHFYYAHISSNSDNKFHNIIMRVDGDSRTRINLEKDPEPRLSKGWRTLKIQHEESGAIRVFVDDLETPLMTAQDQTYPVGKIGFGAFDDRAAFATLTVD